MRFLWLISIGVFALQTQSIAQELCKPIKNSPELSFTVASFFAGDLDHFCAPAIQRALSKGFTTMTLVPARVFYQDKIVVGPTVSQNEIGRCLDLAWKNGLNIIYQPHLESDYLINPSNPNIWRAYFDFLPQGDYDQQAIEPFLTWLQKNKMAIIQSDRLIRITMAAELEKSTTKYGGAWKSFSEDLKLSLKNLNLEGHVFLGYDPNWWPMAAITTAQQCADFRGFIQSLDFVAPSLYGDWSQIYDDQGHLRGAAQVNDKYAEVIGRLTHLPQTTCAVPEMAQKTFAIGEFGMGGDPKHAEAENDGAIKTPQVIQQRRGIFSNILAWAKMQNVSDPRYRGVINIWTGGVFDPVGVLPTEVTVVDDSIAQQFVNYSQWRCTP